MNIKPIETIYNGYRFRSRLEARWAVFFDALGIQYEYEKEGYDLGEAGWYLPDFWLPELEMFVEIKGREPNETEERKIETLAKAGYKIAVLGMIPHPRRIADECAFYGYADDEQSYIGRCYFGDGYDWPYLFCVCPTCGRIGLEFDGRGERVCTEHNLYDHGYSAHDKIFVNAYTKARQARFEHGERGY